MGNLWHRPTRRWVLASGGALAAGALAACGGSSGAGADTSNKARQPVNLTFESYASGGQAGGQINEFENWKQALDRAHQKYPWITVDSTFVGSLTPGSYDRWTAAMAAGTAPSIMEFETKRMASFAEKGTLLDLTPYSAKSKVARKEDFIDADWDKTVYKGKQWIMLAMSKPALLGVRCRPLPHARRSCSCCGGIAPTRTVSTGRVNVTRRSSGLPDTLPRLLSVFWRYFFTRLSV